MTITLPTVVTISGLQPQPPTVLWQQLLASVAATNPGYTSNLPGSLIEDVSSTEVAGIVLCDSARVETVDSVTPFGCNAWILNQLGQVYGVPLGQQSNTSVGIIFSGPAGFPIPQGFIVTDGTYQYVVQDGGVIQTGGTTDSLSCLAVLSGSWAVLPGTVTQFVSSVPAPIVLTCTNPLAGIPGQSAQTESGYRAQVLQAGLAASIGMPSYIKTIVGNVPGVQQVATQQQPGGGWKVLVLGGDNYAVAYAILQSVLDISSLIGSTLSISNITTAADAVVTTALNHNYANGQVCFASGVQGMTAINGLPLTVTVIDEKNFSTGVDTTSYPHFLPYTTGGFLLPNFRNILVSINNYPDIYNVLYISPPQQTVSIAVTWNTNLPNFINVAAIAQLGAPAIAAYINSIAIGQPINVYLLQSTLQVAVSSVLPASLITQMLFSVSINGVGVVAIPGSGEILGDPESYFYTPPSGSSITFEQG